MIGFEGGHQSRAFELVALGHGVGAEEALLVDVDAEAEGVVGVEAHEAQRQNGPAVVDGFAVELHAV